MKTEQFKADKLANLLHERTIATMDELKAALGTDVYLTVLRKLQKLGYISSCSHGGQYYSLKESAEFDDNGLWRFGPALFSRHGNSHGALDQSHIKFFESLMNRIDDPADQTAVIHCARMCYRLYGDIFRAISD